MTAQIANTINDNPEPQAFVLLSASHHVLRRARTSRTLTVTSRMLGCFRDNALTRQEFLGMAT